MSNEILDRIPFVPLCFRESTFVHCLLSYTQTNDDIITERSCCRAAFAMSCVRVARIKGTAQIAADRVIDIVRGRIHVS